MVRSPAPRTVPGLSGRDATTQCDPGLEAPAREAAKTITAATATRNPPTTARPAGSARCRPAPMVRSPAAARPLGVAGGRITGGASTQTPPAVAICLRSPGRLPRHT